MKRTPLKRKTPLRSHSQLRRSPMKPWRRKPEDKMSPEVHDAILTRDKVCFVFEYIDRMHQCATTTGITHGPGDLRFLTVEHVKVHHRTGKRAPNRVETGVALCGRANDRVPSQVIREVMRARLAFLYPDFWAAARAE